MRGQATVNFHDRGALRDLVREGYAACYAPPILLSFGNDPSDGVTGVTTVTTGTSDT